MGNNTLPHLAMMYTNPLQTIRMVKVVNSAQQCCACCLLFVSSISHRCVGTTCAGRSMPQHKNFFQGTAHACPQPNQQLGSGSYLQTPLASTPVWGPVLGQHRLPKNCDVWLTIHPLPGLGPKGRPSLPMQVVWNRSSRGWITSSTRCHPLQRRGGCCVGRQCGSSASPGPSL